MRKIIICFLPLVLLFFSFQFLASRTVSVLVTDESGQPIANAAVVMNGSKSGTVTNVNGSYPIVIPNEKTTLVYSAVGYETKEVKVKDQTTINVILKQSTQSLQEVVVTALGIHQQRSIGATSTVRIRGAATLSNNKMLYGRVPGVQINDNGYYNKDFNTEEYEHITENGFQKATDNPLSTFSIDVNAASYSNIRRFLNEGQLPPAGAVRIE
ncbi:MAG: hypothetical protein C4329_09710 [Chitinophagaceae bacterium]